MFQSSSACAERNCRTMIHKSLTAKQEQTLEYWPKNKEQILHVTLTSRTFSLHRVSERQEKKNKQKKTRVPTGLFLYCKTYHSMSCAKSDKSVDLPTINRYTVKQMQERIDTRRTNRCDCFSGITCSLWYREHAVMVSEQQIKSQ